MTLQAEISWRSQKMIQEIVHETGESQIAVIEHAILAYYRAWRMQNLNKDFAKLKQNKKAWKEELKERSI